MFHGWPVVSLAGLNCRADSPSAEGLLSGLRDSVRECPVAFRVFWVVFWVVFWGSDQTCQRDSDTSVVGGQTLVIPLTPL